MNRNVPLEIRLKVMRLFHLEPEDLPGALFSEEISFEEFLELLGPVLARGTYGRVAEVSEALSGEDGVLEGLEDLIGAVDDPDRRLQKALKQLRLTLERGLAGYRSVVRMARVDRIKTDHVHQAAEEAGMVWADLHKSARATRDAFRGWYRCFLEYIQDAQTTETEVLQLCAYGGPIPDPSNPRQTAIYRHPETGQMVEAVVLEPEPGQMAISWRDWRNIAQYIGSRRTLNATSPSSIAAWAFDPKGAIGKGSLRGPSTSWEADGLEIYARLLEELLGCLSAFQELLNLLKEGVQGKLSAASKLAETWKMFTPGTSLRDRAEWFARLVYEPSAKRDPVALAKEQQNRQFAMNYALELLTRDQIWFLRADLAKMLSAVLFSGTRRIVRAERGSGAVRPDAFVALPLHDVGQAVLEAVYEDETARMLAKSRVEDPAMERVVIPGAPALPGTVFAAVDGALTHNDIDAAVRVGLWKHLPLAERREKLRRLRMAADQNAVAELRRAAHLGTPGWNDTARLDLGGGWLDREAERVALAEAVGKALIAELSQVVTARELARRRSLLPITVMNALYKKVKAKYDLYKDWLNLKISDEALKEGLGVLGGFGARVRGASFGIFDRLDFSDSDIMGLGIPPTLPLVYAILGGMWAYNLTEMWGWVVLGLALGGLFGASVAFFEELALRRWLGEGERKETIASILTTLTLLVGIFLAIMQVCPLLRMIIAGGGGTEDRTPW